ncbi:SWIM zinc finger family protein [Rhodovulum viride]|uniref:SWIM zinc finger family protein n=1 Tax=Rhodovulum viride TaxID=1231134 RepID=UPI0015EBD772|nr:SWIM zinc finger family protein [Rhodovulum viride]
MRRLLGRPPRTHQTYEKRADDLFIPFDLACGDIRPVSGDFRIVSFAQPGVVYDISLSNQTCSCPDFVHRSDFPVNNLSRWCKHLMAALSDEGTFEKIGEWHKAIADARHGGPIGAFTVTTEKSQVFLLTAGRNPDWINVFGRTRRKGEQAHQASGPIREFGWCISQQRWSYGEAPPGARELRRLLLKINEIQYL